MLLVDARSQASDGLLELAVLGGVDERVHACLLYTSDAADE